MATLLAASTGGHLAQLHALRPRLVAGGLDEEVTWVTFDSPQSRSLLRGEHVAYLPYIAPRDPRALAIGARASRQLFRRQRFSAAVSTGSGIALAVLPLAAASGARTVYIESAARAIGPSLTGRVLHRIPGIETYCQYESWARTGWAHLGSVFDGFECDPIRRSVSQPLTVAVTLGTIPYRFDALIDAVSRVVPTESRITWQVGCTPAPAGTGAQSTMPQDQLATLCRQADVVIAHAGIGSALMALEAGKVPILVPRRQSAHEHVDDHQHQIGRELSKRGLALTVSPEKLDGDLLWEAASRTVRPTPMPSPISLPRTAT